jgi:hypothetical protein
LWLEKSELEVKNRKLDKNFVDMQAEAATIHESLLQLGKGEFSVFKLSRLHGH